MRINKFNRYVTSCVTIFLKLFLQKPNNIDYYKKAKKNGIASYNYTVIL